MSQLIDPREQMPGILDRLPNGVSFYRCDACTRFTSEWEIRRGGVCPRCKTGLFRGANPSFLEWIYFMVLNLTHNWRVWGPEGWGWKS